MSQIVICAPHGFACGGGGGLIAASDLVVAADDLKIMFPELKRGLQPALLFPLLRRKLSDSALRWMVLTGMAMDAQRAKEFGLVHDIVKPGLLDETVLSLAREVCSGEPETVRFAKRQMQSSDTNCDFEQFQKEMLHAVEQHTRSWFTEPAQEGVTAFLEKRLSGWSMDNDYFS
jgi:methylglutaconyl-CoA hydratase